MYVQIISNGFWKRVSLLNWKEAANKYTPHIKTKWWRLVVMVAMMVARNDMQWTIKLPNELALWLVQHGKREYFIIIVLVGCNLQSNEMKRKFGAVGKPLKGLVRIFLSYR